MMGYGAAAMYPPQPQQAGMMMMQAQPQYMMQQQPGMTHPMAPQYAMPQQQGCAAAPGYAAAPVPAAPPAAQHVQQQHLLPAVPQQPMYGTAPQMTHQMPPAPAPQQPPQQQPVLPATAMLQNGLAQLTLQQPGAQAQTHQAQPTLTPASPPAPAPQGAVAAAEVGARMPAALGWKAAMPCCLAPPYHPSACRATAPAHCLAPHCDATQPVADARRALCVPLPALCVVLLCCWCAG